MSDCSTSLLVTDGYRRGALIVLTKAQGRRIALPLNQIRGMAEADEQEAHCVMFLASGEQLLIDESFDRMLSWFTRTLP